MTVARITSLIAGLMVALSVGAGAWGKAQVDTEVVVEAIDALYEHPCADEDLHIVGEVRYRTHYVEDANGGRHLILHTEAQADGVGVESGDRYRINSTDNGKVNANGNNEQMSGMVVFRHRVIGQGQAPNGWFELTLKTTINANGDYTVQIEDEVIGCR